MKKIIALILVCLFAFTALAACGGDEESSEAPFVKSEAESTDTSAEESKEESTPADESEPAEESGADPEVVFTNKYVHWGTAMKDAKVNDRITDAAAIALSKVNDELIAGDVGVFTSEFGKTIKSAGTQDYSEFAVVVLEYDHKKFSYVKKDFYDVGKANGDIKIPADGYVLAIYKSFDEKIKAIKNFSGDTTFFPHGFVPNTGLNTKIKAASKAPVIDGAVSSGEYGTAIWKIEPKNTLVSYAQFENEDYYASAEVYLTYDKDFLYLGVIVDSPYHDNTCTSANAGSMYNFESIQVNVCSEPTDGDYISEHWDNVVDPVAANTNVVRQYGFCVNNNDETLYTVWMGTEKIFNGTTVCKRDDTTKKTVYEAAIPWSECGSKDHPINVKSGSKIGFSVSINCGSETAQFKNIVLRDGGGIIGLNDWTKVPTITLG